MSTGIIGGNCFSITILQATVDLGSVAANTSELEDVTLNGVQVGDIVMAVKPTLSAGLAVIQCYVDEKDSLKVTVMNTTASPIDAGAETWDFIVFRPETVNYYPNRVLT